MDINGLHLQTDISNVKYEATDIQFDNLPGNPQQSVSEIKIVHVTGRNDSKKCADPNNEVELTMSDFKSVKMPNIILQTERIKIVGKSMKLDVSVGNSNKTKCETLKNLNENWFKEDQLSVHSAARKNPEHGKQLKCFYCEKTFAQECHRTLHHKTHTGDKIDKIPLDKQKFNYRSNQKICEAIPTGKTLIYKCSHCEKGFSAPSLLQIHERTHTGEKSFKCSFCNLGCTTSYGLKLHERTHTGEKPYKCSFCNNRFTQLSSLKSHGRTHTGETPFKCSFCSARFNQKISLKCHERTHTAEKPFKNCHQKDHQEPTLALFRQVGNQKDYSLGNFKHQKKMHSTCHIKKCSFCEMTFSHDEERVNHEKIHKTEDEIMRETFILGI